MSQDPDRHHIIRRHLLPSSKEEGLGEHRLQSFVSQLSDHTRLTNEERSALIDLPAHLRQIQGNQAVVERERPAEYSCIVLSGLLARTCHTQDGATQITCFYVPGEIAELQTLIQPEPSFGLQALCSSEILCVPHCELRLAMFRHPGIDEAICRELVRHSDIASEWIVNVGRRSAKERIAHLFCEIAVKLGAAQQTDTTFDFPATQQMIADATGLSAVHVNRSLQTLRSDGFLHFAHGKANIPNWDALAFLAGFDGAYLGSGRPLRFVKS